MTHWLKNAVRGLCMGMADIVPGVSGATVALILGIYPRLIDAVGGVRVAALQRLRRPAFYARLRSGFVQPAILGDNPEDIDAKRLLLLLSVGAGVLPALALGARVLPPLLDLYPGQMQGFFLGMVLASVIVPFRGIRHRGPSRWVLALVAAAAAAWFSGLPERSSGKSRGTAVLQFVEPPVADVLLTPRNLTLLAENASGSPGVSFGLAETVAVPSGARAVEVEVVARMAGAAGNLPAGALDRAERSPAAVSDVSQPSPFAGGRDPGLAYVFLAGVLAISAMSLPGLSGAFVLLLLGLYHYLVHALKLTLFSGDSGSLAVVTTMVLAMATGLLTFARVLRWLFSRWRDGTLAVLAGLMVGSVRELWPFAEYGPGGHEVLAMPNPGDPETMAVAGMFVAGAAAVLVLEVLGRRLGSVARAPNG